MCVQVRFDFPFGIVSVLPLSANGFRSHTKDWYVWKLPQGRPDAPHVLAANTRVFKLLPLYLHVSRSQTTCADVPHVAQQERTPADAYIGDLPPEAGCEPCQEAAAAAAAHPRVAAVEPVVAGGEAPTGGQHPVRHGSIATTKRVIQAQDEWMADAAATSTAEGGLKRQRVATPLASWENRRAAAANGGEVEHTVYAAAGPSDTISEIVCKIIEIE